MFSRELVPIVETQVKERLTGAVILVTLMVLLVPELLTGGPGKEPQPADTAAPPAGAAGEAAVRTYSIDLVQGGVKRQQAPPDEPDLSARAVTKPETAAEPDATVEPAKVAAEQVSAQPQPSPAASQQDSAQHDSAVTKRTAEPLAEQAPPPAVSKPTPAAAKPAPVPQLAKVEPKPAATTASRLVAEPSPKGASSAVEKGWAVQLGSFASRENAQRLAKQLKGKGYNAYVLGGGGSNGKLYRVRVGPEPDRAAANALAAKLRTAGQKGSVVSQP